MSCNCLCLFPCNLGHEFVNCIRNLKKEVLGESKGRNHLMKKRGDEVRRCQYNLRLKENAIEINENIKIRMFLKITS